MLLEDAFLYINRPPEPDRDFVSNTRLKEFLAGIQHKELP